MKFAKIIGAVSILLVLCLMGCKDFDKSNKNKNESIKVFVDSCAGDICSSIAALNNGSYFNVDSITIKVKGDESKNIRVIDPDRKMISAIEIRPDDTYTFKMNNKFMRTKIVEVTDDDYNTIISINLSKE